MSNRHVKSLIHNPNHGLLDQFGDGTVTDGQANYYAIPSNLADRTQDGWSLDQWGQSDPLSPDELTGNALSYDPVYGWATYAWSSPSSTSAFNIFQNPSSSGGGKVYQLTLGNTLLPPSSGWTDESDAFLSTAIKNPARGSLSQQITLSLDAKVVQSITQYTDAAAYAEFGGSTDRIFSQLDIGLTVNFNGADGLPIYSGFVQIVPWNSATGTTANYESGAVSTNPNDATQFIASLLLQGDSSLPMLPSDADAAPDKLTYNVNEYVETALESAFSQFTGAQQAALLNLANWSIGGVYIGPATNDAQFNDPSNNNQVEEAATISTTVQLSDIQLTANGTSVFSDDAVAATQTSDSGGSSDPNPQISAQDNGITSKVDGSVYSGGLSNIQYQYLYDGNDQITLTTPDGENWLFGGGSNYTRLISTSAQGGGNALFASTGGSFMSSGAGDDTFIIPDANTAGVSATDTITGFHAGDSVGLAGVAGADWNYAWVTTTWQGDSGVLALYAASTSDPGVTEEIIFAGFTAADVGQFTLTTYQSDSTLAITETDGTADAQTDSTSVESQAAITPSTVGADSSKMSFVAAANSSTSDSSSVTAASTGAAAASAIPDVSSVFGALIRHASAALGTTDAAVNAQSGAVVITPDSHAVSSHASVLAALGDTLRHQAGFAQS